jgi:hypothetical protein
MSNKVTIYRADDYFQNMGNIVGFYPSLDDALEEIANKIPSRPIEGNFSQVTSFEMDASQLMWLDYDPAVILETVWPDVEIIETLYYV